MKTITKIISVIIGIILIAASVMGSIFFFRGFFHGFQDKEFIFVSVNSMIELFYLAVFILSMLVSGICFMISAWHGSLWFCPVLISGLGEKVIPRLFELLGISFSDPTFLTAMCFFFMAAISVITLALMLVIPEVGPIKEKLSAYDAKGYYPLYIALPFPFIIVACACAIWILICKVFLALGVGGILGLFVIGFILKKLLLPILGN